MAWYCDQCGAPQRPEARFCASCGTPRADQPHAQRHDVPLTPPLAYSPSNAGAHGPDDTRAQFVLRTLLTQVRRHPGQVLANAFSTRLMWTAMLVALVPGVLGALIAPVVSGVLFIGTFVVVWILSAANPLVVLHCPACRKRVKMGALSCHHCGRIVAPEVT